MPTYDYACDACDYSLEIVQSFKDSPKKKCPKCGKSKLRRIISGGVGVVFKGSGFYATDSRSSGAPGSTKTTSDSTTDKKTGACKTETSSGGTIGKSADKNSVKTTEKK